MLYNRIVYAIVVVGRIILGQVKVTHRPNGLLPRALLPNSCSNELLQLIAARVAPIRLIPCGSA